MPFFVNLKRYNYCFIWAFRPWFDWWLQISLFHDITKTRVCVVAFVNIVARKTVTNEKTVLERRKDTGSMVEQPWFCRKGLPRLQRGPCHIPTGLPLHDESGPVATSGGPYGRKNHRFLHRKSAFSASWNCTYPEKTWHSLELQTLILAHVKLLNLYSRVEYF